MSAVLPGKEVRVKAVETIEPVVDAEAFTPPTCFVEVPFISKAIVSDYQDESHRVDLGRLTREQLRKVKAIRRGLIVQGAKLASGAEVKANKDVLLYLLDNLEA